MPQTRRLVPLLLLGLLAASDAEAQKDSPAAQAFAEGMGLYKQANYEGALDAFNRSYRLHPHFLTQCNIARCHERSSDMVRAAEHYRRCLEEGGAASSKGAQIKQAMQVVLSQVARITVRSPGASPAQVFVDGAPVGTTPHEGLLNAGPHEIEVRRPNAPAERTTIQAKIGEVRELVLRTAGTVTQPEPREVGDGDGREQQPKRPTPRRRLRQGWFWAAAAATVVLAIAGTALGIKTLQANGDYEKTPTEDGYNKVIDLRLYTNICWGLTAGAAGAATTLFFFTDFGGTREEGRQAVVVGLQGQF